MSSLTSLPVSIAVQANWRALVRGSEAMVHDTARAGAADLEALRLNAQGMVSEGRKIAAQGRTMAAEIQAMVHRHKLDDRNVNDLRQAAQAVIAVGDHLRQNGQDMIDYVDGLQRSMGMP